MATTVPEEQYTELNLMAGTARSLEAEALTDSDIDVWTRDFNMLVNDLSIFGDPELGNDLKSEKSFYDEVIKVAKGYFDAKPFGGLKAATGQFGFRLLGPQDLKQAASALTPAYYSWAQTLATTSSHTYAQYAIGYSSGNVYTSSVSTQKEVLAFHRLVSYKPAPRLMYVEWSVNGYPYMPYDVEPYSKINKENKLFKTIPMPGRIILHPGGGFYTHFYFDLATGATAPSGTSNVDVEIAPFGLVFGEYDYLKAGAAVLY
ncbi:MAG: hypothetical protein PHQ43_01250 [Dehalococcoidales bacterium]|nr:hypothetical protein [Dehalococcoidales bacterium]